MPVAGLTDEQYEALVDGAARYLMKADRMVARYKKKVGSDTYEKKVKAYFGKELADALLGAVPYMKSRYESKVSNIEDLIKEWIKEYASKVFDKVLTDSDAATIISEAKRQLGMR